MKAALVGLNFDTGQIMFQPFDGKTAIDDCHAFRRSIESDWPGTTWGVVADDESCEARVELLLGSNPTRRAADVARSQATG